MRKKVATPAFTVKSEVHLINGLNSKENTPPLPNCGKNTKYMYINYFTENKEVTSTFTAKPQVHPTNETNLEEN